MNTFAVTWPMVRRSFLQTAGAATVYYLADSAPGAQTASPNTQIGMGFIGRGIRGTHLLRQFMALSGVRPLAVADLYDGCLKAALEDTANQAVVTKDYRAILERKDVDAVAIATPDHWHTPIVLDALDAGKHVYIEKPMTWSIEEGPRVIAAVQRTGRVLQVGSEAKTSQLTAKARQIVKSGALGKVNLVRLINQRNNGAGAWRYPIPSDASPETIDWPRFLGSAPNRPFDAAVFFRWRCWWEYSGGVATDLFVHLLTQVHEIMDVRAPKSVVSQGGIYKWNDGRTVPDLLNSLLDYNGFITDICVNFENTLTPRGVHILGSEGSMTLAGNRLTVYSEPAYPDVEPNLAWPRDMRLAYLEAHGYTPEGKPKVPLVPPQPKETAVERGPSHFEYFLQSIRDGTPSRENATEGHFAAAAGHLANIAYREGRKVSWDLDTGKVS